MREKASPTSPAGAIQSKFSRYDVDYAYRTSTNPRGGQIRNQINGNESFLITGWHVLKLEEAKPIGKMKGLELNLFEAVNVKENDEKTKNILRRMIQILSKQILAERRIAKDPLLAPRILKAQKATEATFKQVIDKICGEVGDDKREAIVAAFTRCREEIGKAVDNYFNVKESVITSKEARIRKNTEGQKYCGPEMSLSIVASPKKSGKNSGINIDDVVYSEITDIVPPAVVKKEVPPPVVFSEVRQPSSSRRADWPARGPKDTSGQGEFKFDA